MTVSTTKMLHQNQEKKTKQTKNTNLRGVQN